MSKAPKKVTDYKSRQHMAVWWRGYIAHRAGAPRRAPYTDDSAGARGYKRAWEAGWDSGQHEIDYLTLL